MMRKHPRIAVVGAGPGGLVLARMLHLHGVEVSVFEREDHAAIRPQGWSLDMHAESGQLAIEGCGLTAEFKRIARYEDQQSRIYDKAGKLLFVDESSEGNRPEVDRAHLREMLLNSLPEGMIRWNHSLEAVGPRDNETFELMFRVGASEVFDLVVGADGAWSRVRPLVSEASPIYSGVTFVELGIADVDTRHPEIARLVGRGLMFALGDSKAIIAHRDANAHIGAYAGLRVPEDWLKDGGLDRTSDDAMKAGVAGYFADWSDDLRQLLLKSEERMVPRPIYALPVGHRWESRPGVTLLGDAAHLMSPFSGEGANLAMLDAAELAGALASEGDWRAAVRQFEIAMFARAEEAAAGARDGVDETFSDAGLSHALRHMQSQHA